MPNWKNSNRSQSLKRGVAFAIRSSPAPLGQGLLCLHSAILSNRFAMRRLRNISYYHIRTELFRSLKGLKLEGVKTVVLEDLRYIKRGKRGTFSRQVKRLPSFWSLTRARDWLRCRCEELGVRMIFVSPYKTS